MQENQIQMRKQCSFLILITLELSLDLRQNSLIATDLIRWSEAANSNVDFFQFRSISHNHESFVLGTRKRAQLSRNPQQERHTVQDGPRTKQPTIKSPVPTIKTTTTTQFHRLTQKCSVKTHPRALQIPDLGKMQGAIGKVKAVRVVDRSVEVEWGVIRVVRSKSWAAVMDRIVCVDLWTSVGDVKIRHGPDLPVEVKGKVFHKRIFFCKK